MMKSTLILAVLIGGTAAHACPKNSSIAGYDAIVRAYGKKDFAEVTKRYDALCTKKKSKVVCSSESVSEVRADDRAKEVIGNEVCKEAFKVPEGPGMVKLLILKPKS